MKIKPRYSSSHTSPLSTSLKHRCTRGFALIATISIMALLIMIALGMLSLSRVELRSSQNSKAVAEAQANARMALMIAIGELQKQMGPDQRISANGAIVSIDASGNEVAVANPHWTGVWDSWKAEDDDVGNPDGFSAHSTIEGTSSDNVSPTYVARREDHFRSWLVSHDPQQAADVNATIAGLSGTLTPGSSDVAVTLVSLGSVDQAVDLVSGQTKEVAVPLQPVIGKDGSSETGRYGWWVGDQSQKSRVMVDTYEQDSTLTVADSLHRQQAPGSTGNKRIGGLEGLADENEISLALSMKTLDLLEVSPVRPVAEPEPSRKNFHSIATTTRGVLADIREGGLKLDLSTLLEQPIDIGDTTGIEKHMLYSFIDPRFTDDRTHSQVPIQDLSAYYQLYQNDPSFSSERRGGVEHVSNNIQVTAPDFGQSTAVNGDWKEKFLREYSTIYRNPVPIRVQFVVAVFAQSITDYEREYGGWSHEDTNGDGSRDSFVPKKRSTPIATDQTHKLITTIIPVLTMWNPNNVGMVMSRGEAYSQVMKMTSPAFYMEWIKYGSDPTPTNPVNMMYMATGHTSANNYSEIASMSLSDNTEVSFEPGEVKIFSIPTSGAPLATSEDLYESGSHSNGLQSATTGWDPSGFSPMTHSASSGSDVYRFYSNLESERNNYRALLTIGASDALAFTLRPEDLSGGQSNVTRHSKVSGSAFNFWLMNRPYTGWKGSNTGEFFTNYMFTTRAAGGIKPGGNRIEEYFERTVPFNQDFMAIAFPEGKDFLAAETSTEAIVGDTIIKGTELANETTPLFQFTLAAASEVSGSYAGFENAGRRVTTRPFLHGATISPAFVDQLDPASLYVHGWDWQLEKINSMDEAPIHHDIGQPEKGYYGGGYTKEMGNTNVVQREIPVLPTISIAAFSHAHLGGYSLGNETQLEYNNIERRGGKRLGRDITRSQGYQRVTALGTAGLAPNNLQAIGNSYAHPLVPADRAFTTWERMFDADTEEPTQMAYTAPGTPDKWGGTYQVPCVDHSYLANKALWDRYFFSSITPQLATIPLYSGGKSAQQVAEGFFFNDSPLPNRRFSPFVEDFTEDDLNELFTKAPLAADGIYESIASHMMVEGPFNINSTSVEAWKVFLSSHRNKPVTYYESGTAPIETTSLGTPVGFGTMTNGEPIDLSATDDAKSPDQWKSARVLSDVEVEQLAQAIVHQVKLRGPFLSLSEFVNRRLDDSNTELSVKGALQAALDFEGNTDLKIPEVTINKQFRTPERSLDEEAAAMIAGMTTEEKAKLKFPEALDGPVAYGSAPYVDQADLLRQFAALLTPRGDTFVIRAYGDSLNVKGNVVARAWCEAVVQRTPDYVDNSIDSNHTRQKDLQSDTNQKFGREFRIMSFRWLNADEV